MQDTLPDFLKNPDVRLVLFGGKGGVGKTTFAAATAIHWARTGFPAKRVLVISTDPAHSLGDSLGVAIGDRVTAVALGRPFGATLFARELDADATLEKFRRENGPVMRKLAERGTYFDREDIAGFFDLSLPGMDEVMAIIEMAALLKGGVFDRIVVDTAPTGHTLRMLHLPARMEQWIEVLDLMQHKHRYMSARFTRRPYVKDECDLFLARMARDVSQVKALLSDARATRFVPVMIPESMCIEETRRLVSALSIPVREMVVNRVAEAHPCPRCSRLARTQGPALARIDALFPSLARIRVPLFPLTLQGIRNLDQVINVLSGRPRPPALVSSGREDPWPAGALSLAPGLTFILFGGKGGVGKTSLAAATALLLAKRHPEKRVLVFSTDPAHSLSDAFDQPVGGEPTAIRFPHGDPGWTGPGGAERSNLHAVEMDAFRKFEAFRDEFRRDIEGLFERFLAGGLDVKFDREVMTRLLDLAPPGLDEIMALDSIVDLQASGRYDLFILDSSPTGHLLRFLEMPGMVRQWLNAFFQLLVKYKGTVRLTGAAERALELSRNVKRIQQTLTDAGKTEFVAVTIPETMAVLETRRLVGALQKAGIPCGHVAVNLVAPASVCAFCKARRGEQQERLKDLGDAFPQCRIACLPLLDHDVHGIPDLRQLGDLLDAHPRANPRTVPREAEKVRVLPVAPQFPF